MKFLLPIFSIFALISCNDDKMDDTKSDTQGDVAFKVTFSPNWTSANFPTQYPSNAHWSPLVGTVHNELVEFWELDGAVATNGITQMAQTGATTLLTAEIETAKSSQYSQGVIQGSKVDTGEGSISVEFETSDTYPLLTLTSMIAPSPDWFVGVASLSLQDEDDQWIDEQIIELVLYDAGTDDGVTFTSTDSPSSANSILLVSSERTDSDFSEGVHVDGQTSLGTLTITRIQ